MLCAFALLLVALTVIVVASPTPGKRQSITILSAAEVATFKPYTFYASAGYCQPENTIAWNCGVTCEANPAFKPVASGGDGGSVQFWYVGYDPILDTVIVGHQGSDFSMIATLLTDVNAILGPLDSSLFPGVPDSVEVHEGFRDEQEKTATQIRQAVLQALPSSSSNTVTLVGHSLGAALALLDGLYLRLNLPGTTIVKVIVYGSPRVGNPAFADIVDSKLPGLVTYINNKEDIVPILPGKFLGYAHPNGELHIKDDNSWASCPGHDNPDDQCIVGDVPTIFDGDVDDHTGPYDGVDMGC